ncbi:hypothetical protein C8R48DRAFT_768686 [Suillus tomentosus]|nr:hypothetical protein C8R48DRAFT_768686 [Suillus tomentosus]
MTSTYLLIHSGGRVLLRIIHTHLTLSPHRRLRQPQHCLPSLCSDHRTLSTGRLKLAVVIVGAIFALLLSSQTKRCLITSTASFPSPSSMPTTAVACPPFARTTTISLQGDSSSLSSSLEQSLRCLPIPSTPLIASPLSMWLIIASPTLSTHLPAARFPYPTGALAGG